MVVVIAAAYRQQTVLLPLLIAVALAASTTLNHFTPPPAAGSQPAHYRTPDWLQQHITLGYQRMLSVLYWFDIISTFGGKLADETDYFMLSEKLDTITTLNPYAGHAYYTAATVLTWQLHSTTLSGPLLERAIENMPQEWRWPYYRGFYSYFFDHDIKTAARYLAIAAKNPNTPPLLLRLTAKMRAEHEGLDTALLFLQQLLKKRQEEEIKTKLEQEIIRIRTEQLLRRVDHAIAHTPDWDGTLQQLRRRGVQIPEQLPDGGHIILNKRRVPVSSAEHKRYQLFRSPAYLRR
ncbi:MAG: hypothetical protein Q9M13_01410 [Mariprofundales bacterium]|nr:hypothetical protein [Mariprofundales bacterium]